MYRLYFIASSARTPNNNKNRARQRSSHDLHPIPINHFLFPSGMRQLLPQEKGRSIQTNDYRKLNCGNLEAAIPNFQRWGNNREVADRLNRRFRNCRQNVEFGRKINIISIIYREDLKHRWRKRKNNKCHVNVRSSDFLQEISS